MSPTFTEKEKEKNKKNKKTGTTSWLTNIYLPNNL